ncbi:MULTISPECIES: ATP-binding protein [unclassified Nitrospina]|uniref:ATP-binding protein n=1 Tax=unclassified Nitrospina TaxID=2638683 RepID=UPI003F9C5F9E
MSKSLITSYDGFDPLEALLKKGDKKDEIFQLAKKREIKNILKSYTGYFDLFSEMIQNALDATEKVWRADQSYEPEICIKIDLLDQVVSIADNGCGMSKEEFEFCVAPNFSFKRGESLRGNKGVGATFLAYGFNNIKLHTKSKGFETYVMLTDGRKWVESESNEIGRPKFKKLEIGEPYLNHSPSGTITTITLYDGERPSLSYINATTAKQWFDILRIRTPLGQVNIQSPEFKPNIKVEVKDYSGSSTAHQADLAEYFYPHEIPNIKAESISALDKTLNSIPGDLKEKHKKIPDNYKRLDAVYEVWDKDNIVDPEAPFNLLGAKNSALTEEENHLIQKHHVSVYGFFSNTVKVFDKFNDDILKIRKGYRILKGGLQIASDQMVQGDLITIPLTKSIGYQNQTHVIVHFKDGEPDLGRKSFQPEKTELARKLSVSAFNKLKQFRSHLKPDEKSDPLQPDKDKFDWISFQQKHYENHPLPDLSEARNVSVLSVPQKEQDVVTLYNQLIGASVIRGIELFSTSEHFRYDCVFRVNYKKENEIYYSEKNSLGVSEEIIETLPWTSEPKILEYKYEFDALLRECSSNEKFHKHIDLVVAWCCKWETSEDVELKSLLIGDRGRESRKYFGSTHIAYLTGQTQPVYEVLILEDLFSYLMNPEQEQFNQQAKYEAI